MALTSSANRNEYTGDNSTTDFALPYLTYDATHVQVYLDGVLQSAGYTVTGVGDASGVTVVFAVAPGLNVNIVLLRVVPYTQLAIYAVAGAFPAKTTEKNFDLSVMRDQQLAEELDRTVHLPVNTTLVDSEFPVPGAGQFIRWNAGGTALEAVDAPTQGGTPLAVLAGYTFAGLPAAGTAGRLARVTDNPNRGVYLDDGSNWRLVGPGDAQFYWDSTNKRLGLRTAAPIRLLDLTKEGAGLPQLRLTGTASRYTDLRCTGDGTDDGDFFINPTGSTFWFQSQTDTYPSTLELVPKGVLATNSANLELYGTDYIADAVNYERLRISAEGSTGGVHEITSEKGGTGTIRPIHLFRGDATGIYLLNGTMNGVGTLTPRVKWDILSTAGAQLRLSYQDNTKYADFSVDTNHHLTIAPSSTGNIVLTPGGDIKWGKALVTLGGGAAPTLGTIGGSGPAAAAQNSWLRLLDSTGAACWVPVWK